MSVALEWMVKSGMNEYISKEYIRNVELKRWSDACGAESYAYSRVLDDIAEAPIADVIEVKHGHWENDEYGYHCSVCKCDALYDGFNHPVKAHHCSHCGAKMNEGE